MRIGDADLETTVLGTGEPILWLPTALTNDELVPAAHLVAKTGRYRSITYRRRGYGASSPADGASSIDREVADARRLLDALGIERAHVVGVSFSAAIALRLTADAPDRVASLCVIEPPPLHVPAAAEFRAACAGLQDDHRRLGAADAAARFLERLGGPTWRADLERQLPGGVEPALQDATTFFTADLPALLGWTFGPDDAARISCPVHYLGGSASGEWFAQVRPWILDLLPHAEDAVVPGAGHSVALTHPDQVAAAVADFLGRHPLEAGPPGAPDRGSRPGR